MEISLMSGAELVKMHRSHTHKYIKKYIQFSFNIYIKNHLYSPVNHLLLSICWSGNPKITNRSALHYIDVKQKEPSFSHVDVRSIF